jgi:Meiotic cell cortex C-terminal pleckstrin homology
MKMANPNADEDRAVALQALNKSLPTPSDTPYRSPAISRRNSRYGTPSPGPSSSPPPTNGRGPRDSQDAANDENISILDPRRFTPTLHANLVSEILSLRRDLDSKHGMIDNLEGTLHSTQKSLEASQEQLGKNGKEIRSFKRQLALLEGGTSSALSELARERDEAVDSSLELKRRLETSQKKARLQEEDSDRTQSLWERDKANWDTEKRAMERKVHIVEGRLKAVLDEFAAQQAAAEEEEGNDGEDDGTVHGSDTASIRSLSRKGRRPISSMISDEAALGVRFSMSSTTNGVAAHGLSLADELNGDDSGSEYSEAAEDMDGRSSRTYKHRKMGSMSSLESSPSKRGHKRMDSRASVSTIGMRPLPGIFESSDGKLPFGGPLGTQSTVYVDAGTQWTEPSPEPVAQEPTKEVQEEDLNASPPRGLETGANQRKKRVSVSTSPMESRAPLKVEPPMVSTSAQTLEQPISPPETPLVPNSEFSLVRAVPVTEMVSMSTQTETQKPAVPKRAPPPPPIPIPPIPTISVHPPTSVPSTPKPGILPPANRDVACQASIQKRIDSRSISVQTDAILIDKRPVKLPPHLMPSALNPNTRSPSISASAYNVPRKSYVEMTSSPPLRNQALRKRQTAEQNSTRDAYPGNNDNGPLVNVDIDGSGIKRPFRTSSLFAGFDGPSSDEADDFGETEMSDSDYRTALSAPRPRSITKSTKHAKMTSKPTTSMNEVPEVIEGSDDDASMPSLQSPMHSPTFAKPMTLANSQPTLGERRGSQKSIPRSASGDNGKPMTMSGPSKQASIRKSALITSGTVAHSQRARSPSLGTIDSMENRWSKTPAPPFPVPTRASSRRMPFSRSDGTQSPTPGTYFGSRSSRDSKEFGHRSYRKHTIRKSRSDAALPGVARVQRPRSRSPPALSSSSFAPDSPEASEPQLLPPLPRDEITTPSNGHSYRNQIRHSHAPSNNTSNTGGHSVASSVQQTSVVDAIAQTMVGEWMWKYVRRRKSFGVPESPQGGWDAANQEGMASNGVRHKRWVWLAPYERAVMWSSRQPTTGSALLGKSGRKCKSLFIL